MFTAVCTDLTSMAVRKNGELTVLSTRPESRGSRVTRSPRSFMLASGLSRADREECRVPTFSKALTRSVMAVTVRVGGVS